jgi:hypothetical protein
MIRTANPVNRSHPLNAGRMLWWLSLPHLVGGPIAIDLMGLQSGALTSMGNSSNGWRPSARPGGVGHIQCDGTAGSVNFGSGPWNSIGTQSFAYALWFNIPTASLNLYSQIFGNATYSGVWSGFSAYFTNESSPFRLTLNCDATTIYIATPIDAGVWYRLLFAKDGASFQLYLNGALTTTFTGIDSTWDAGSNLWIGRTADSTYPFYCPVLADDLSFWLGNPLVASAPDTFAALDYTESIKGYPRALNRRSHLFATTASSSSVLFRRALTNRVGSRGIS